MSEPVRILIGDVLDGLALLPERSVHCCVTSPPYWGLRDYSCAREFGSIVEARAWAQETAARWQAEYGGERARYLPRKPERVGEGKYRAAVYAETRWADGSWCAHGLEATPDEFVAHEVEIFRAAWRVLRDDGTLWLNLGDCYAGSGRGGYGGGASTLNGSTDGQDNSRAARIMQSRRRDDAEMPRPLSDQGVPGLKPKDLCLMPYRVLFALQADGWYVRSQIVWAKKSPMPESCRDRPTSSWEPIFLLAKNERYFYDAEAVKEASESTGGAAFGKVNKIEEAEAAGQGARRYERPDYREIGRNQRNVWHLGPEPYAEAHFATFPTEIPRRAIKAGTSEKGCCARCGAPWVRKVATSKTFESGSGRSGRAIAGKNDLAASETNSTPDVRMGPVVSTRTIGWEPGCACNAGEPVPCVVLDPFLGSGTTVAVARTLGRHGVGCELNPEYAKLARERIGKAEKPGTFASDKVEEAPLFGVGVKP